MSTETREATCETCEEVIEQELTTFASLQSWTPTECGKCAGERARREEREQVEKILAANRLRRLSVTGVKQEYLDGTLTMTSFLPSEGKRGGRMSDQHAREKRAVVACEEWGKGLLGKNGVYLFGEPGLGKSHLAQAALIAALKYNQKARGRYVKFNDILAGARDAMFRGEESERMSEREYLRGYLEADDERIRYDYLVIDDLGATEKASDFTLRVAYVILETRLNRGLKTIITANYDLPRLSARLMPEKSTDTIEVRRIVERIVEYCELIELKGDSYR